MLFNASEYYFFLLLIVPLYYAIPHRHRWILLLLGSYFFYLSWRVEYGLLLLLSTVVDYYAGLKMGQRHTKKERRPYLILSLFINLGMLCSFKYLGFLNDLTRSLLSIIDIHLNAPSFSILLPIGISFYTFQTLSYTIDVYRGIQKPEQHFGIFALYVSFFPQLVSGPIERPGDLLPQFYQEKLFNFQQISNGLKLIIWGLFLKMILADRLALYVNAVFEQPEQYVGLPTLAAIYFFAIQVYGDFAGYTNIAVGSAMLLGFRLSDNFRLPYLSRSIQEFWSRWHITLTTWMRDYLYISLGGNRKGKWRTFFNLYLTFLAVAVWHGTDPKLLLFGTLHFLYYLLQTSFTPIWQRMLLRVGWQNSFFFTKLVPVLVTFHLVAFTWVVWWADSWAKVKTIIFNALRYQNYDKEGLFIVGQEEQLLLSLFTILFTLIVYILQGRQPERYLLNHRPRWLRWLVLYILLFALIFLSQNTNSDAFIYFQF